MTHFGIITVFRFVYALVIVYDHRMVAIKNIACHSHRKTRIFVDQVHRDCSGENYLLNSTF